jgi:hypothetical protein
MPLVQLARGCGVDELAQQIDAACALRDSKDALVINFPHGGLSIPRR